MGPVVAPQVTSRPPRARQRRERGHANSRNDRQQRSSPRMQYTTRGCRFDNLLGDDRKEKHHGDIVDSKCNRQCEPEVTFGSGIDPRERDQRSQRKHQQVLERES